MARLFRRGTSQSLQKQLFRVLQPRDISAIQTKEDYDNWIYGTVEQPEWQEFSRGKIESDRWAYFAKLINILAYEIISNRELVSESDWQRLHPFLHLPIDSYVISNITKIEPGFARIGVLKGMTKVQYRNFQEEARNIAAKHRIQETRLPPPPIWLEDAFA